MRKKNGIGNMVVTKKIVWKQKEAACEVIERYRTEDLYVQIQLLVFTYFITRQHVSKLLSYLELNWNCNYVQGKWVYLRSFHSSTVFQIAEDLNLQKMFLFKQVRVKNKIIFVSKLAKLNLNSGVNCILRFFLNCLFLLITLRCYVLLVFICLFMS